MATADRAERNDAARWLRAQRERRRLTVRKLAELMDVDPSRITAYEHGAPVPIERVPALAGAFGLLEVAVWRGLGLPLPADLLDDMSATHPTLTPDDLAELLLDLSDEEAERAFARYYQQRAERRRA